LLFDIETAPNLGWIWGKYEQNVLDYVNEWYVLCFAAKWLNEKETDVHALPDFHGTWGLDKEDDYEVVNYLWLLLDEADIVIAHNGDQFDIRKINTRFLAHGMNPPSPYRTIDTLKVARRYFKFNSNKLDDLAQYLGIGRKVKTGGFELWKGCMSGDAASWDKMKKYNQVDVKLLEEVYLKLRPWIKNHPTVNMGEAEMCCPNCGSNNVNRRGFSVTRVSRFQRYRCMGCGAWSRSRLSDRTFNKPRLV